MLCHLVQAKEKRRTFLLRHWFYVFFNIEQLTRNTSSTRNDKNNTKQSCNTHKMWKGDTDSPQVSIGGGFRGVSIGCSSPTDFMAIQETFDNRHVRS